MVDDHRSLGAVILAGGAARRLGGVDKPGVVVGGRTLLDIAILACTEAGAADVVVVGPPRPTEYDIIVTREDPPGGGPLAGLAAGLTVLPPHASPVAVLAADLPGVTGATIHALLHALDDHAADGAVVADDHGRLQLLTAAYHRAPLAAALALIGDPAGQPVRALLPRLRLTALHDSRASADIDTPDDLARWLRHS